MDFHHSNAILHLFWMLPVAIALMVNARRWRRKRLALVVAEPTLAASLTDNVSTTKRRWRDFLFVLAIGLIVVALAGPHWGSELVQRPQKSRDLMVLLDTSRSMLAKDVVPNRMAHAKWFLRELLNRAQGNRFGLIAFAGDAFLECPLTQDVNGFLLFLEDIDTGTIPIGGTNIERALKTALEGFKAAEGSHRAIILVTDGDAIDGDTKAALSEFKERKIPIFVVGIGDTFGSFVQIEGNKFITDENGDRVKMKLNEPALKAIASATNGSYVHSSVVHDGLDHVVERIRGLVPEQQDDNTISRPIERFQVPLFLAVLCLLLRALTGERRASSASESTTWRRPVAATAALTLLVGLFWGLSARAEEADERERPTLQLNPDRLPGTGKRLGKNSTTPPPAQPTPASPHSPAMPPPGMAPGGAQPNPLGADSETVNDAKEQMIRKAIEIGKEQLESAETADERAYHHYNLGVNYQLLGRLDQAEESYQDALDAGSESEELRSLALQNLGVLKHQAARENLASDHDAALTYLDEAQTFYREAMRNHPDRQQVARNQEQVLLERRLVKQLQEMQQQMSEKQQEAKERTEEALEAQQQANAEQDPQKKQEKQKDAQEKTEKAEEAVRDLAQGAEQHGQEQAAERMEQAANQLEQARKDQEEAQAEGKPQAARQEAGEEAEEKLSQVAKTLGAKPEQEKEGDKDGKEESSEEAMAKKGEEAEESESSEGGKEGEQNQEPQEMAGEPTEGNEQEGGENADDIQDIGKMQALRILEDMQQQEKDFKQAMKESQMQNRKLREVKRNW